MLRPTALRARHRVVGIITVLAAAWIGSVAAVSELTSAAAARPGTPLPWPGGAYLLTFAAAGALAWRIRRPLTTAAVVVVLVYAYRTVGYPGEAPGIALFVVCYAVGAYAAQARWRPAAVTVAVLATVVPVLPPHPAPLAGLDAWSVLGPGLGMVTAMALGASVRYRRTEAEERLRHAGERAEHEIVRRLAADRLLVARELHDVLAHTISVISVQSALALDVLDDDPQRARPALEVVRRSSRQAIEELRAAVRALRRDEPVAAQPPLTLAALERVADGARAAGLQVSVDAPAGDDVPVPPLLQAAAFRIVQEALTNCLRHSRGRTVTVRVTATPPDLTVEVLDDGRTPDGPVGPAGATPPAGLGLQGIRERAEAVGGRAETGWRAEGGFRVFARLPMPTPVDARDPAAGSPPA